jgi:hypothetical protein
MKGKRSQRAKKTEEVFGEDFAIIQDIAPKTCSVHVCSRPVNGYVNAEENPGKMYEGKPGDWVESRRVVSAWRFEVEFESLSEPYPERKRR